MFTDLNISKELNAEFHQKEHGGSIDLSVSVLTMGTWPNYQPVDVNLPSMVHFLQMWL